MKNKMKTDKLGPGPKGTNLPPDAAPGEAFWKPFQRAWALLSIHPDGLVVYNNDRIVVPEQFRQAIIQVPPRSIKEQMAISPRLLVTSLLKTH